MKSIQIIQTELYKKKYYCFQKDEFLLVGGFESFDKVNQVVQISDLVRKNDQLSHPVKMIVKDKYSDLSIILSVSVDVRVSLHGIVYFTLTLEFCR